MDDQDDIGHATIVEDGVPTTALPDEITAPHATEPGVLAVLASREPPTHSEWVLGFQRGAAAKQADIRRAVVAEAMSRGAPRGAAEDLAAAVLDRANGQPRVTVRPGATPAPKR